MFAAVIDIVVVAFVDLDGRILRIDLAFDERLENFWDPDIEADLSTGRDNFEGKMFLDAAGISKFVFVAQDSVERSEKLFRGKLFFVVRTRDFKHQEDGVDV